MPAYHLLHACAHKPMWWYACEKQHLAASSITGFTACSFTCKKLRISLILPIITALLHASPCANFLFRNYMQRQCRLHIIQQFEISFFQMKELYKKADHWKLILFKIIAFPKLCPLSLLDPLQIWPPNQWLPLPAGGITLGH